MTRSPRRSFLVALTAAAATVAGCAGGGATDSDGDGVVDDQDYAPKDPDVQEKSDLAGAAGTVVSPTTTAPPTVTPTPTATPPPTRTPTPTPSRDDSGRSGAIEVTEPLRAGESSILAYGPRAVTARVVPDGPSMDGAFTGSSAKLLVFAYTYPRDDGVVYGVSDPVTLTAPTELTATVDLPGADPPDDTRLHYLAFLMPGEKSVEEVGSSELEFFHETDAFVARDGGRSISRDPHPVAVGDDGGDTYERDAVEGAYSLSFEGSTGGQPWSVGFYLFKSSYVEMVREPRGRSRPEYVSHAQQSGFADELAVILAEEAAASGFTDKRRQVEFIVDFAQGLPYVPDDVSTGFDDYTKFITETLVEIGGDCEDTAIMLASVLQAEPFGYDMVLLQPPGHMAAGIYGGDDLPGYYYEHEGRRYYYIETTGQGWGIGDLPDIYRDEDVYVHQV